MTTPDSSSAAESSMDDGGSSGSLFQTPSKTHPFTAANSRRHSMDEISGADDRTNVEDREGDSEVWKNFGKSFLQVQSVLDRNRILIQQVNENHQSKIPENLVKNIALIQEINGNISKVVSLYSDLSSNFLGVFHQRQGHVSFKDDHSKGVRLNASKSCGSSGCVTSIDAYVVFAMLLCCKEDDFGTALFFFPTCRRNEEDDCGTALLPPNL